MNDTKNQRVGVCFVLFMSTETRTWINMVCQHGSKDIRLRASNHIKSYILFLSYQLFNVCHLVLSNMLYCCPLSHSKYTYSAPLKKVNCVTYNRNTKSDRIIINVLWNSSLWVNMTKKVCVKYKILSNLSQTFGFCTYVQSKPLFHKKT